MRAHHSVSGLLGLSALLLLIVLGPAASRSRPGPAPRTALIDELPFVIRQPGRYELSGNLTLPAKPRPAEAIGIVVQSDDVTIDLGGFTLAGSEGSAHGIAMVLPEDTDVTGYTGLVVRGGSVRNWGGHGIDARVGVGCRFESLTVGTNGIAGEPFSGMVTGTAARVIDCTVTANALHGIEVGAGSVLTGSVATVNGASGFALGAGSICQSSVATANGREGFFLEGPGGLVESCSASGNRGNGIALGGPGQIRDCSTSLNDQHGLVVLGVGLVADNLAYGNGGAGVELAAPDSRIDGNHLAHNLAGLRLDNRDSVAVRNTLAGNTDDIGVNVGSVLAGWLGRGTFTTTADSIRDALGAPATTVPAAWANLRY